MDDPYGSFPASLLYVGLLLGASILLGTSLLFEFCHQKWSVYVFPWFPRVVGIRIPFPANEVLFSRLPCPHVRDLFYFPLHHPFNQVRWWFHEVFSIFRCLLIGVEQLGMEDIVYLPMSWQLEAEIYMSHCLENFEGSVSLWA